MRLLPVTAQKISTSLLAATLVCVSLASLAPQAHAAALPGAALDSPIARYLLTETAEGAEIAARLGLREIAPSRYTELRTALESTRLSGARQGLESRLTRLREEFHSARQTRAGREIPESAEFSTEEKALLKEIAARELRVSAEWNPAAGSHAADMEFLPSSSSTGNEVESFLAPETDLTRQGLTDATKLPSASERKLWERLSKPFKEMRTCVQNEPPAIAASSERSSTIKQLLISEGITLGATYFTAGERKIDKASLSGDMLMTLFSTGVGGMILKSSDSFLVRWNKTAQFGLGRAQVDAGYYYITPWKTVPHGYSEEEATRERLGLNVAWNLGTSLTSPTVFTLTSGVECLYRGTRWESLVGAGTFLFRTAVSTTNAVIYYEVRGHNLGTHHK